MRLCAQGAIFFTQADDVSGNETLGDVNHTLVLLRYPGAVLYCNSAAGGATTAFKNRTWVFGGSKKAIAGLGGHPKVLSTQAKSPPDLSNLKISKKLKTYKNFFNFFENLSNPVELTKLETPRYINVDPCIEDTYFFYDLVDKYRRCLKPKYIVDVGVFKYPPHDFFYGRPMFCHNFVMQLLGLNIGNVLTSLHLKQRLLEWSGKTNFYAQELPIGSWENVKD